MVIKTLLDLVRELNALNDDNLAERVIKDGDVQWCLLELQDILEAGQSALWPVSREQVEKAWRGEWRDLHGDKLVGIDDVGQDVYRHYHYSVCEKCGKGIAVKLNFCRTVAMQRRTRPYRW